MIAILARNPLAALLGVLLALVLAWGAVVGHRLTLAQRDGARQAAAIAAERAQIAQAAASAQEHARSVEAQRAADIATAQEAYHAQITLVAADAADARAAADRLRDALTVAARALRTSGAARGADTASSRETGARAAELLGACVERYRGLAVEADRAVAAGQLCERAFDAVSGQK